MRPKQEIVITSDDALLDVVLLLIVNCYCSCCCTCVYHGLIVTMAVLGDYVGIMNMLRRNFEIIRG